MNIKDFLLGYEEGKAQGGGSSADVRYVTFMSHDGAVELGKKAVAVGDDCADPIARGIFDTPTKESTAQYDYSFVGWATTPNGAWDETALNAVTEDRTVYAAYAAVVRYYTVSFYDGDTLLTTKQVVYGGSVTYTPQAKDGYFFSNWDPEPTNVISDLSCYAQYKVDVDFATATWAEIAAIAESGQAAEYFSLGEERTFTFTTPSGETVTSKAVIIAFNQDVLKDGSIAGITLCSKVSAYMPAMNDKPVSFGDKSDYYAGGWAMSKLRTTLNNETFSTLPVDMQNVIKSVKKDNGYYDGSSFYYNSGYDKLWYFSQKEMGFSNANYSTEGTRYPGLTYNLPVGTDGNKTNFRMRSAYKDTWRMMMYNQLTTVTTTTAQSAGNAVFGFCI